LHLPQGVISNAKGKHMDNPEYTEIQINEALKAATGLPITVSWDGSEPCSGETANFEVCFGGDTIDILVRDHGPSFDIRERLRPGYYVTCDQAARYDTLAEKVIGIIETDMASGRLGE
jgi:hypothetical protein